MKCSNILVKEWSSLFGLFSDDSFLSESCCSNNCSVLWSKSCEIIHIPISKFREPVVLTAPQYLCSWPPPQSSPAAPGSCPPCRLSCRSNAAEPRWCRSSWRTPQTWPDMARRSAPGITETLDSPSQESGDSLRARTWTGKKKKHIWVKTHTQKTAWYEWK